MSDERSTFRKVLSLGIASLMIATGAIIFGNWLFFGGGLPRFAAPVGTIMIVGGLCIAYDDWKSR